MPQTFSNVLKFLGNALVYPSLRKWPRDQRLWAFGAPNGGFEGNAKYLYLWLSLNGGGPCPIWITTDHILATRLADAGYQAATRWSVTGLSAALRAGVYFVNDNASDVNFSLSNGAVIFNLWHGVGLKNVLYGSTVGTSARLRAKSASLLHKIGAMRRLQRPDWVLSTSREMSTAFFARCFAVPAAQAPALGYPRLDPQIDVRLKQAAQEFDDYTALEAIDPNFRSILYVPTLRERGTNFLAQALPDLVELSAALAAQDAHLFVKLHPKMMADEAWSVRLPTNITLLPAKMDLYAVIDRFAALVTDYSSMFFDFIACSSAGVVLYTFDRDDYLASERDFAWDYDEVTLGTRVDDFGTFCAAIRTGLVFQPLPPQKLSELRQRFWDGELKLPTASERIREFVMQAKKSDR